MRRLFILLTIVSIQPLLLPVLNGRAMAISSEDPAPTSSLPLYGRERMHSFVLYNYDRIARLGQPLPALSADSLKFNSESFRPQQITRILESFNELFPGMYNPETENVIEIVDADQISAAVADKIAPVRADVARDIQMGIKNDTLCWYGKVPTDIGDIPFVLVSQNASGTELSNCLYRGVLAHMGVTALYKDRYPAEGRLNAILSHMANIAAIHIFFECRQPIRDLDFSKGRNCIEQRLDELY
ncbi:MAG TPA: hypothetical protein VKN63_12050 [Afifellaceae bacterium]|nr:hypothetical protein [Afifellaceae bacterium]